MNRAKDLILLPLFLFVAIVGFAQSNAIGKKVDVKVRVVDKESSTSINTAEVSVHGKLFRYNSNKGYYFINAHIGDELVVSNSGFEVVYHRITSSEDIRVEVDGFLNDGVKKLRSKKQNSIIDIQVLIFNKETKKPITNAYVYVNGVAYEYSHIKKYYPIRAKIGDKMLVSYDGETGPTYTYTIESDKIEIKVDIVYDNTYSTFSQENYRLDYDKRKLNTSSISYKMNLDSAQFYKKIDIEKSLSFIENILRENYSKRRNGATYRLLGDIYYEWKQYDLALSSYKNSLQYVNNERTKLLASKAAIKSEDFDEAQGFLMDISTEKLGLFEKILTYESLGDIYLEKKNIAKANVNYNKALKIAENNRVPSKVTDLNSKLGDVSVAQGDIVKANKQFQNSIKLASKENPVRAIEEKEKVADFFNSTQQFDKEINLRKETLEETKKVKKKPLPSKKELNTSLSIGTTINEISDDSIRVWLNAGRTFDGLKILGNNNEGLISFQYNTGVSDSIFEIEEHDFFKLMRERLKNTKEEDNKGFKDDGKSISSQSINYKIGRALVEKEDYKEAIPFLKKSIEDAEKEKDYTVKKDATRKLSEVYDNVGEYDKALRAYRDYVALVDTLYIRKSQEIEQAKRQAKSFSDYQNRIASLEKNNTLNDTKVSLAIKDQQLVEEQNKNQRFIIYSLGVGILAMVFFTYLLSKSIRQQKTANNLLALKSMRSQMNPHFIFNALNSVNSFIAVNDERNANRYLSEFSVLMRSVLENSDEDFIPFTKEIELLELYVKLEHNRFKDKFEYQISVDETIRLEEYSIPPMLLQPYIENAIWHGLRYKEEKGNLSIRIDKKDSDSISVVIQDDGVGRKKSKALKTKNQLKRKSKGMNTIQNRIAILNNMYHGRVEVQVSDAFEDGTGTKVELILKRA